MRKLISGAGAATLALLCLCAPATAGAAPSEISEKRAKAELRDVERLQDRGQFAEPTTELRDLVLALPALDGRAERRARAIILRPPDQGGDPDGRWPDNAKEKVFETPTFVVHYARVPGCSAQQPNPDDNCDEPDLTVDENQNGHPDYVDAAVDAMKESIAVENVELGWPYPKGDGSSGEPNGSSETDRLDIYLSDLCDESDFNPCFFGYALPDDFSPECRTRPFECSAHLVIDNDYDNMEFGASSGMIGLQATTAHEYNHALQFALDTNYDDWMGESTATWSEEHVFPKADDWVQSYMDYWSATPETPITDRDFRWYGSAVWNHWLERGDHAYGPDVILNAWQSLHEVTPKDYGVGAYDDAIKDEGGEEAGFPEEFAAFTAATAEWNTGDGNLPNADELPQVTRRGALRAGEGAEEVVLDNTSYALYRVVPDGAGQIRLSGRSSGSVRWSVALVGRTGGRFTGSVDRIVAYADGDDAQNVKLPDAGSYNRITAVVTNADGRVTGPKPNFGEFTYSRNNEEFRLKVR